MTSSSKKAANQKNAKLSTGPKSPLGRKRSSRNSRRHGLAVSVARDPVFAEEARSLAEGIMAENNRPELREFANRIAEAQVDLNRIHLIKQQIIQGARDLGRDVIQDLRRLDRYERRAWSRRKAAMREFVLHGDAPSRAALSDLAERSQNDQ